MATGYNYLLSAPVVWSNTVQYKVSNITNAIGSGGSYVSCPVVTNSNVTYYASNPSVQPTLGTAPASDSAWSVLGETATEVLNTPLTGFSATSGAVASTSTILQAIEYLSYPTYLLLNGLTVATVSTGAISLATVSSTAKSTNITVNSTSVSLPLNFTMKAQLVLNVTTSSASGATFTITGTNCTVVAQSVTIGASTTVQYIVNAIVTTTSTASPSIAVTSSSVTGTVAINSSSSLFLMV